MKVINVVTNLGQIFFRFLDFYIFYISPCVSGSFMGCYTMIICYNLSLLLVGTVSWTLLWVALIIIWAALDKYSVESGASSAVFFVTRPWLLVQGQSQTLRVTLTSEHSKNVCVDLDPWLGQCLQCSSTVKLAFCSLEPSLFTVLTGKTGT